MKLLKEKILFFISLLFIFSCFPEKNKSENDSNKIFVAINLKTITICEDIHNPEKIPTFIFYLQMINYSTRDLAFFVQNFDKKHIKSGFFLKFETKKKEFIIELADFWSSNPEFLFSKDTLNIMLTSLTSESIDLLWNKNTKKNFLNSLEIIYFTDENEIAKDTSLKNLELLPKMVIKKNENTKIFD